ncbi:MAG: DUF4338 domain-containing protein [Holophagales bacterium]|jgi:hypothetical protein|nr:DUF4338 domain-containing protein [Holophagales bacterium]
MEEIIREFSGKTFSAEDIQNIKWIRKTFPKLSLKELAATICETTSWVTISGVPKKESCIKFLRQLAAENIIDLPAPQNHGMNTENSRKQKLSEIAEALPSDIKEITKVGGVELELVQAGPRMQLLRAYLKKYHIIGDSNAVGEQLYYFINDNDGTALGCMRFSPAAWALEEREDWIGWTSVQKKARLFLIVNQSRYLIFPWVHVKNLSSRALSVAAKRLPGDWLARYCYEPVLIETFVDTDFFKGTCYQAASWECIGHTKGRGRNDRHTERAVSIKDIYVRPLRRDFRDILTGKKAYKVVASDV